MMKNIWIAFMILSIGSVVCTGLVWAIIPCLPLFKLFMGNVIAVMVVGVLFGMIDNFIKWDEETTNNEVV